MSSTIPTRLGPIGQVSLHVRDIERATRFYAGTLGLPHLFTFGDLAFFDASGVRLYMHSKDEADWRPSSVVYFTVADVHAAQSALADAGVAFTGEPHRIHTHDDGTEEWMTFFDDGEGNTLALMSTKLTPPAARPPAESDRTTRPTHTSAGTLTRMHLWTTLFRHHRWANLSLIDFLRQLPEDQLHLTVPGTYGSPLATMRHLVSSDADYVRIIPDAPDVPQIDDQGPFEGWDELRNVAETADTALLAYVDGRSDDAFFIDIDNGTTFDLTTSMLLNQVIHHATDHRGQIITTLSAHGIEVPDMSTWSWRKTDEGRALLDALRPSAHE